MALDSLLIEILVDPEDKQPLWYFESEAMLYNPRLQRRYDIVDGIPILLIAEATTVDEDEARRIEQIASTAQVTGEGPVGDASPAG